MHNRTIAKPPQSVTSSKASNVGIRRTNREVNGNTAPIVDKVTDMDAENGKLFGRDIDLDQGLICFLWLSVENLRPAWWEKWNDACHQLRSFE